MAVFWERSRRSLLYRGYIGIMLELCRNFRDYIGIYGRKVHFFDGFDVFLSNFPGNCERMAAIALSDSSNTVIEFTGVYYPGVI